MRFIISVRVLSEYISKLYTPTGMFFVVAAENSNSYITSPLWLGIKFEPNHFFVVGLYSTTYGFEANAILPACRITLLYLVPW